MSENGCDDDPFTMTVCEMSVHQRAPLVDEISPHEHRAETTREQSATRFPSRCASANVSAEMLGVTSTSSSQVRHRIKTRDRGLDVGFEALFDQS